MAADAQYKLAQAYEEAKRFDDALEAYVTLASTLSQEPLITNAMIRISEYFYKREVFDIAAQVGIKFVGDFDSHKWSPNGLPRRAMSLQRREIHRCRLGL